MSVTDEIFAHFLFLFQCSWLQKEGTWKKRNAWPCHKKGGLAAYKADLPGWFGAKIAANSFIYSLRHEIHPKNNTLRCVGHNVDTLKHTARIFSTKQRKCRNSHQDWVWTKINEFTSSCNCNLYSKHRACGEVGFGIWFKHHGKYFQTPWKIFSNTMKKTETHEAGSQKSTWPLLLTVVTNYTFVFTRFSFISPEQRGWIVSEEKMKLLKSYWFSWHWPILRTFVFYEDWKRML